MLLLKQVADSKGNVLNCMGHTFLYDDYFSFYKFLIVMDGISANDLFQASAFSKGYNGKRAKGFFTTLICL